MVAFLAFSLMSYKYRIPFLPSSVRRREREQPPVGSPASVESGLGFFYFLFFLFLGNNIIKAKYIKSEQFLTVTKITNVFRVRLG